MRRNYFIQLCAVVIAMSVAATTAQAQKPGNPCGGKGKNPCNPCGGKSPKAVQHVSVNPCHAKHGTVFHVADRMGRNQVSFASEAPLEDIIGTTNEVVGYLIFDPRRPQGGVRGLFTVPIKSLDTGIPLRDEHLQSDVWLDANRFPDITFSIDSSSGVRRTKNGPSYQTYDMNLLGTFQLHGRSKQVTVPARVTYLRETEKTRSKMPGNLLGVRAKFALALADFEITGPEGADLIASKVGESVAVDVSVFASDQQQAAGNPCNPCGGKTASAKNPRNPCGGKQKARTAMNPCNPCDGKKVKGQ